MVVLTSACLTSNGKQGPPGSPGPEGPPGDALVWKDAAGHVIKNAYPMFSGNAFTMVVSNSDGVFFQYRPLSGLPALTSYDSTTFWHYYLTTNCSGDIYIDVTPIVSNVAIKLDSRVVALPSDIPVLTSMGSYWASNACYGGPGSTAFVKLADLNALPTLAPPLIGPGPYHVEAM